MRNLFSIISGWPPLWLGMIIIDVGSFIILFVLFCHVEISQNIAPNSLLGTLERHQLPQ
jgi:hypothetical protein